MKISITIHRKIQLHITKFQNLKKKNSKRKPILLSWFTITFFNFFIFSSTKTSTMSVDTVGAILIKNGGGREEKLVRIREDDGRWLVETGR